MTYRIPKLTGNYVIHLNRVLEHDEVPAVALAVWMLSVRRVVPIASLKFERRDITVGFLFDEGDEARATATILDAVKTARFSWEQRTGAVRSAEVLTEQWAHIRSRIEAHGASPAPSEELARLTGALEALAWALNFTGYLWLPEVTGG